MFVTWRKLDNFVLITGFCDSTDQYIFVYEINFNLCLIPQVVSFGVAALVYLNVTGHGRTLLYLSFFPTHAFNLSVMLSDRITTIGLFVIRYFANHWLRPSAMSVIEVRLQKHVTNGYHRDRRDLSKSHLQKRMIAKQHNLIYHNAQIVSVTPCFDFAVVYNIVYSCFWFQMTVFL